MKEYELFLLEKIKWINVSEKQWKVLLKSVTQNNQGVNGDSHRVMRDYFFSIVWIISLVHTTLIIKKNIVLNFSQGCTNHWKKSKLLTPLLLSTDISF